MQRDPGIRPVPLGELLLLTVSVLAAIGCDDDNQVPLAEPASSVRVSAPCPTLGSGWALQQGGLIVVSTADGFAVLDPSTRELVQHQLPDVVSTAPVLAEDGTVLLSGYDWGEDVVDQFLEWRQGNVESVLSISPRLERERSRGSASSIPGDEPLPPPWTEAGGVTISEVGGESFYVARRDSAFASADGAACEGESSALCVGRLSFDDELGFSTGEAVAASGEASSTVHSMCWRASDPADTHVAFVRCGECRADGRCEASIAIRAESRTPTLVAMNGSHVLYRDGWLRVADLATGVSRRVGVEDIVPDNWSDVFTNQRAWLTSNGRLGAIYASVPDLDSLIVAEYDISDEIPRRVRSWRIEVSDQTTQQLLVSESGYGLLQAVPEGTGCALHAYL